MSHSTPSSIPPSTPPSLAEDPGASSRGVQGDGASTVAGAPATPPRTEGAAASASVKATPRVQKPGNTALATTATALKQDAVFTFYMWKQMLQNNFAGIVDVDEFLAEFMPPAADEGSVIAGIVEKSQTHLDAVKAVLKPKTEDDDAEKLVAYFNAIVQDFPAPRRPVVADTHKVTFKSIDGAHETKPDITSSRPGLTTLPEAWPEAGTVIELKHKLNIFNDSGDVTSDKAFKALIQLTKSARSLLMASNACYVYVVSLFEHRLARIFRFDHCGWRVTTAFDWKEQTHIFPTFFYRLYNRLDARMDGDDDTISIPTSQEKRQMEEVMRRNNFYDASYLDPGAATVHSLWITATRFKDEGGKRVSETVQCFTIGSTISISDGLFSRATHVYRVILKEDMHEDPPTIYALKDVWRQSCRRPEVDFYDTIAKYCEIKGISTEGMAQCHGSLDLSVRTATATWDVARHQTRSAVEGRGYERCHTRSLLTPVGTPLKGFRSTKAMVDALYTAVLHHQIAAQAGVLHRDISDGNVLLQEGPASDASKGFLVDWDYAEFIDEGLENFQTWFPERKDEEAKYIAADRSLKDMTGTLPFIAIKIMDNATAKEPVAHGAHHDLESIYWLLVWMILRHTKHDHPKEDLACSTIFDGSVETKRGFTNITTPVAADTNQPLFELTDRLRDKVWLQSLPPKKNAYSSAPAYVPLTYENVCAIFREWLDTPGWPTDDKAIPFKLPDPDPSKAGGSQSLYKTAGSQQKGSGSKKRSNDGPVDDEPRAAGGSDGTGGTRTAKRAKTKLFKLNLNLTS